MACSPRMLGMTTLSVGRGAAPDLADWRSLRHLAQRACPRCTARHQGGPVRRLFAHHEYPCTRHGYWIGPPDPSRDDPLTPLAAARADRRAVRAAPRRHGWAATFKATAAATGICIELRFGASPRHPLRMRWERRMDLLLPADYQRSLFMAVIFPEVAALPAVRSAPHGHAAAGTNAPPDAGGLLGAAQRALGCADPSCSHDISDVLTLWAEHRAAGRMLEAAAVYPRTGHQHDGTPRVTNSLESAERRIANYFRRDRRAPRTYSPAAPLPYACRPAADGAHGAPLPVSGTPRFACAGAGALTSQIGLGHGR
jgi:hypothetical protein